MKKYLSFGGGINSTALLLLLTDENIEFETVFVNHGGDYPATYEYINYLKDKGFAITEIVPNVEGCHTILEYCYKRQIIPIKTYRWCTDKFKIRPIHAYVKRPCEIMIGISYDESSRCRPSSDRRIINRYPLVERKITRKKCIKIIQDHGLKVPQKSGCFFCPFMTRKEARNLFINYPELYQQVLDLEHNCCKRGYYLKGDMPFQEFAMSAIPPLTALLRET